MLIHQWEYVKVDVSCWKYSYLVKGNLVKAHCEGFGIVYFLFITPLSEELLFFKKKRGEWGQKNSMDFLIFLKFYFNKVVYSY